MNDVKMIEFNAGIYPNIMSIAVETSNGKGFQEGKMSIDLPRGVYILYLKKMLSGQNELEKKLFKKYSEGDILTDSDYKNLLSLIMKPIQRNRDILKMDPDFLNHFGVTIKKDEEGNDYFSILEEVEDSIRVEFWEGILLDILNNPAMEIISCFDFERNFQRNSSKPSENDKICISLGAWKFTVDNVEQRLSNALRDALMFALVGYYVGDRKNQYSSFEDYFEEEFFKRVSLVYSIWSSIERKEEVKYIPLYDSFYNLSSTSKNELMSVLKAILDNDDIALDERQTLKRQIIDGLKEFHLNLTEEDTALEQELIKPAINPVLLREKAKETIESAEILYLQGKYVDCANRCYYSMMYTLKILLEYEGKLGNWKSNELKERESHGRLENALIGLVSNGVLDSSDEANYKYVKDQRWKCDYSLYNFSESDASMCIGLIKKFFLKVEETIAQLEKEKAIINDFE